MDIAVRLAEPTDAPELPIIEHDAAQVFRAVEGLEWIAREAAGGGETYLDLVEAGTVWVADAGGVLCGFLAARVEGEEFHIVELSVRRSQQRRGVARALIERAALEARRLALSALTLTTFRDVPWNAPLYRHLGYRDLAEDELGPELRRLRDDEAAHGLDPSRRVCMRRDIE